MSDELSLIGYLTLGTEPYGFVDPVFLDGDRRYLQRTREDPDIIAGFDEISVEFSVEPSGEGMLVSRSIGIQRLYAFRFADGTIESGDREELSRCLKQRMHEFHREPILANNLFLLLDVLSFLEYDDAVEREMKAHGLLAAHPTLLGAGHEHHASTRLAQHGFHYIAADGRLHETADAGVLCVHETDLRDAAALAARRLKTGRLFPVFCLFLLSAAPLLVEPLSPLHGLQATELALATQAVASLTFLWFIGEIVALGGRLTVREMAGWLVVHLKRFALKR